MNAGATSERVYDALRSRILVLGFRPGHRFDPSQLADDLGSSVTPVRDALHMLAGEGLVESRTSEGFYLPHVDEPGLRDLYAWSGQLVLLALRSKMPGAHISAALRASATGDLANATAALFLAIAQNSTNAEHIRALASTNARLNAARLVEGQVFADAEAELATLQHAWVAREETSLRQRITRYHRRRWRSAATIVRLLYRAPI